MTADGPRKRFFATYGKPVAFNRAFIKITGNLAAAYVLSQMVHWTESVPPERDGWFFKVQTEWQQELGLTRDILDHARKVLVNIGLISESRKDIHLPDIRNYKKGQVWCRINIEAIETALENAFGMRETRNAENPQCGKPAMRESHIRNAENPHSPTPPIRNKEYTKSTTPLPPASGGTPSPPHRRTTRRQRAASIGVFVDDGWTPPTSFPDDPRAQQVSDALANGREPPSFADLAYLADVHRRAREEFLSAKTRSVH